MEHVLIQELKDEYEELSADGFRVLAVASKETARAISTRRASRPTARPTSAI